MLLHGKSPGCSRMSSVVPHPVLLITAAGSLSHIPPAWVILPGHKLQFLQLGLGKSHCQFHHVVPLLFKNTTDLFFIAYMKWLLSKENFPSSLFLYLSQDPAYHIPAGPTPNYIICTFFLVFHDYYNNILIKNLTYTFSCGPSNPHPPIGALLPFFLLIGVLSPWPLY